MKTALSIEICDKTSGVKRLARVQDRSDPFVQVPPKSETVECICNIAPEYLRTPQGLVLCNSRAHYQGKIYWGTVTTYELQGTAVNPQEPVQVPRRVHDLSKPFYLAVEKARRTKWSRVVRGWVKRHEWDHRIYYPKTGTSILKKRKFPLDRRPTLRIGYRPGVASTGNPKRRLYTYLINHWITDSTAEQATALRPVELEYLPSIGLRRNIPRLQQHTPWVRGCEATTLFTPVQSTGRVLGLFEDEDEEEEERARLANE